MTPPAKPKCEGARCVNDAVYAVTLSELGTTFYVCLCCAHDADDYRPLKKARRLP